MPDMPAAQSPTQLLAEMILERPLVEYIDEKRTARPRWPWTLIAEQLSTDTEGKVNVSHEWLRQVYVAGTEVSA